MLKSAFVSQTQNEASMNFNPTNSSLSISFLCFCQLDESNLFVRDGKIFAFREEGSEARKKEVKIGIESDERFSEA